MSKVKHQRIFDEVWKGIKAQGGPAWDEKALVCMYRTPSGRSCAIGLFLTDEEAERFEGITVDADMYQYLQENNAKIRRAEHEFLISLQRAHDSAAENEGIRGLPEGEDFFTPFRNEMKKVAENFDLNTKVLDNE